MKVDRLINLAMKESDFGMEYKDTLLKSFVPTKRNKLTHDQVEVVWALSEHIWEIYATTLN